MEPKPLITKTLFQILTETTPVFIPQGTACDPPIEFSEIQPDRMFFCSESAGGEVLEFPENAIKHFR